jgi:hypothetical protein
MERCQGCGKSATCETDARRCHTTPRRAERGGCGGSLEDELCPDEIEARTAKDASPAVCPHYGNNRRKGLILDAGGDILASL